MQKFIFSISFFIKLRKTKFEKWAYGILISFTGILIFNFLLAAYLKSLIEDSQAVIDSFKNSYEILDTNGDAGSGFSNKGINFSTTGILLQSPGAIFTTLFRPYIWEARKPILILASIEGMFTFFLTVRLLFKSGFINFFKLIAANPSMISNTGSLGLG